MVLALDCGHAVNPAQIAAQVEGSVAYGLSAAFFGECTVDKGRIVERNFDTYEILRLADMPKVETVIVPSYDFWGGSASRRFASSRRRCSTRSSRRPGNRCARCR
jgi:isoquinoline 1-oxidoreductase beta subunit